MELLLELALLIRPGPGKKALVLQCNVKQLMHLLMETCFVQRNEILVQCAQSIVILVSILLDLDNEHVAQKDDGPDSHPLVS